MQGMKNGTVIPKTSFDVI